MKIFNAAPEGNESADVEPARYFNLAISQINEIELWMRDTKQAAQPLLVHLDIFVTLAKKYPSLAKGRKRKLKIPQIKETFYAWYERCSPKIPEEFRAGIKSSADSIFLELENV